MKLKKSKIKKTSHHKKVEMNTRKSAGKWANFSGKVIKLIDDNPFLRVRGYIKKLKASVWIKELKRINKKKTLKVSSEKIKDLELI
jgi:hypothetical protein